MSSTAIDANLVPLLGEFAWHSLTLDPTIDDISAAHLTVLREVLGKHHPHLNADSRILEVASYAHTTGYQLHEQMNVPVELFDISASTLRLGLQIARDKGFRIDGTTRTAGDFHQLPYQDAQFDVVYICSALHHTWRWQQVLSEMIRVLVPGGILFLENEPCRRGLCFNKFRTNRPAAFTPFEKKLEELGIVWTIAEAYLGSRPESLFGMVENQTMPLGDILDTLDLECSLEELTVQPELCMGPLEHALVDRRGDRAGKTRRWLVSELKRLVEEARGSLTDNDRGLGFDLPSRAEIKTISRETSQALSSLPKDPNSIEFRKGLSELFGAAIRLVARKKGSDQSTSRGQLKESYPATDHVIMGFRPEIAKLLDPHRLLLPDIQTSDNEVLEHHFPGTDWNRATSHNNIRELLPLKSEPEIRISIAQTGSLLVLIRIYVTFGNMPYRVTLFEGGQELYTYEVYQADSLLLSRVIQVDGAREVTLSMKTVAIKGNELPEDSFRIHYMGAFML